MKNYKGKCSCGNIEYCFEGEPINSAFCYCDDCQTHTGSDKWFGLWVLKEKFRFSKGEPTIFTRLGDSGEAVNHAFCSNCGTTLLVDPKVVDFYSVSAPTLTTENDFSPKMAIYTASAPEWAVFPEGVPKFDLLPSGVGG